ncbi:hypothetical protein G5I_08969 [Acromyrmex echinatior]|uniref:Uncharacterized protein n=1 Tax=Acromyrmex echinatior TaxID=103372 RepID=F4WSZ7_ACREC|nr:hypothetical protein G5I_08969 [Acromyrmex echinatior]
MIDIRYKSKISCNEANATMKAMAVIDVNRGSRTIIDKSELNDIIRPRSRYSLIELSSRDGHNVQYGKVKFTWCTRKEWLGESGKVVFIARRLIDRLDCVANSFGNESTDKMDVTSLYFPSVLFLYPIQSSLSQTDISIFVTTDEMALVNTGERGP